jgi:hypothetical protein
MVQTSTISAAFLILQAKVFHLRHKLGNNLSVLAQSYLGAMFDSMFQAKVQSTVMDQAEAITLEKSPKH